jgi:hypothetical protein
MERYEFCGGEYEPKVFWQYYCKPVCRQKAYLLRKPEQAERERE